MNKKILLVGGTVLKAHLDNGCFKDDEIAGKYFGMSPLSLGEKPRVRNVPKERLTLPLRYDVNNDFDGYLKHHPAEYIFVDLQKILVDLLKIDGHYCTNQPNNEDEFYSANQDKIIKVTEQKPECFFDVFDGFADCIKSRFASDKVILVSSYVPRYFVTGRQVRPHKNKFKFNVWYEAFERRFAERTGCAYYKKSRFFFNEKRVGKPVKHAVFEADYYAVAKEDFARMMDGRKISSEPDYSVSAKRCARFFPTLDKKFLFSFLSKDSGVDRFLMSCPDSFAETHANGFAGLKKREGSKQIFSRLFADELEKTYRAFLAAEKQSEKIQNIDLLFKNKIRVPVLLDDVRKKSALPIKKQITYDNYGEFYFGKTDGTLPRAVDVIGACIARFIFNFNERDFAVNHYAFHYMPIMTGTRAGYDETLFDESVWEQRMMKLQADCGLAEFVGQNKAEWAVVDLFPLIELTAFKLGEKPIGAAGHFGRNHGLEAVKIYESYSDEEILSELKAYAELIQSLYGEKIILIASRRQHLKVDDRGKIVPYTNREVNSMRTAKSKFYEQAFQRYTNCWYVDIVDQFFSHEQSLVSESPVHYEDDCYYEEGKIIAKIIDEMPNRKIFTDYDENVRMKRLIEFKKAGNETELLREIFYKPGDEALLSMSVEQLEEKQKN